MVEGKTKEIIKWRRRKNHVCFGKYTALEHPNVDGCVQVYSGCVQVYSACVQVYSGQKEDREKVKVDVKQEGHKLTVSGNVEDQKVKDNLSALIQVKLKIFDGLKFWL